MKEKKKKKWIWNINAALVAHGFLTKFLRAILRSSTLLVFVSSVEQSIFPYWCSFSDPRHLRSVSLSRLLLFLSASHLLCLSHSSFLNDALFLSVLIKRGKQADQSVFRGVTWQSGHVCLCRLTRRLYFTRGKHWKNLRNLGEYCLQELTKNCAWYLDNKKRADSIPFGNGSIQSKTISSPY